MLVTFLSFGLLVQPFILKQLSQHLHLGQKWPTVSLVFLVRIRQDLKLESDNLPVGIKGQQLD